jgi:hypothetical protein
MLSGISVMTGFSVSGEHWAWTAEVKDPRKSRQQPTEAMKTRIDTEFGTRKLL